MIEQACAEIADISWSRGCVAGSLISFVTLGSFWLTFQLPELIYKRNKMLNSMSSLVDRKEIVTILDLVAAAKVSPEKASKFLAEFTRKLNIEPEVEESTGVIFYRFIKGDRISKLEESKRLE